MHGDTLLYLLTYILSLATSVGVGGYAWRRRGVTGARAFALVAWSQALWILGYIFELISRGLDMKIFWDNMQFIGTVGWPFALLVFTWQYTGHRIDRAKPVFFLLALLGIVFLLITFTDPWHGLIRSNIQLVPGERSSVLVYDFTNFVWGLFFVFSGALLFSLLLLTRSLLRPQRLYRAQVGVIILGTAIPLIGVSLSMMEIIVTPQRDSSPFTFAISNLLIAWGLFRYRLFDIVPVARDMVLENMRDAVLVVDTQQRLVDLNPAASRLITGITSNILGQPLARLLPDIFELLSHAHLEHGTRGEWVLYHYGAPRYFDVNTSELHNRFSRLTGHLIVLHDITDRKHNEEALQQAKRAALEAQREAETAQKLAEAANQAKSMFLANMSHELRTPLNVILGSAQVMMREGRVDSQQFPAEYQEYVDIIKRSGEHLLMLINQVLDLSKIEAGHLTLHTKSFDLHRMLADLEDMFRWRIQDKDLSLAFECAPDVPQYIRADDVKLRQVLINLLNNAIKFTDEGEVKLHVNTRNIGILEHWNDRKDTTQTITPSRHHATTSTLQFCISDTGVGISPEDQESIFEAFVQTESGKISSEGTGLGLTISRQFVRLMGGELTVESEVGRGTVFTFTVAIEVLLPEGLPKALPDRYIIGLEPNQPRYRILIVDDHSDNRQLLINLLEPLGPVPSNAPPRSNSGFDLREAQNGQEAIEIWQTWHPHLIFMDIRMPVMNGDEATREIRKLETGNWKLETGNLQSQIPIIALTASSFEEETAGILAAGCDDFLRKPFLESILFDIITKHLGVRFIYDERQEAAERSQQPDDEQVLKTRNLAKLSDNLLTELEEAALKLEIQKLRDLIERIRDFDTTLADAIAHVVKEYQFEKLVELISQLRTH